MASRWPCYTWVEMLLYRTLRAKETSSPPSFRMRTARIWRKSPTPRRFPIPTTLMPGTSSNQSQFLTRYGQSTTPKGSTTTLSTRNFALRTAYLSADLRKKGTGTNTGSMSIVTDSLSLMPRRHKSELPQNSYSRQAFPPVQIGSSMTGCMLISIRLHETPPMTVSIHTESRGISWSALPSLGLTNGSMEPSPREK